jgi:hypothetical protein
MATANPTTAIQKKVEVSINDGKTFSEEIFFLHLESVGNVTSEKEIKVKDGEGFSGAFKQIQFRFDKDRNYIYTKFDNNQKEFDEKYKGTALEFSISGLSAGNANTVIRTGKTNSANDVSEKHNGPAELVKVIVETVGSSELKSKPEEGLWSSEKWNNGIERTIKVDGPDPEDTRFVVRQLDNDGYCKILGNGVAEIGGKGRFYVFKKDEKSALEKKEEYLWKPNIEVGCDIKVDSIVSSGDDDDDDDDKKKKKRPKAFINVGGCTNHFASHNGDKNVINSNGRNYNIRAYLNRGFVGYEKETIHGIYDPVEAENFPQDKVTLSEWVTYKFRQKVVDDGKNVKLEGWINGKPLDPYTDEGEMTKLEDDEDKQDLQKVLDNDDNDALYEKMTKLNQVWTAGAYSGLYIRLTGTVKTFIKNLSVKEV